MTTKKLVFFDIECYPNYFLIMFKSDKATLSFELSEYHTLDIKKIKAIFDKYTVVGFNIKHYDLPMATKLINGGTNAQLKELSDAIITNKEEDLAPWDLLKRYNVRVSWDWDNIDIKEVLKGSATLKMYGARIHTQKIQDLPYEPSRILTQHEMSLVKEYCLNDVNVTMELYDKVKDLIDLRVEIGKIYNIDARSKSDAQIAEAIFRKEFNLKKTMTKQEPFKYKAPDYIKFDSPHLQELVKELESYTYSCGEDGKVIKEDYYPSKVTIAGNEYTIGIGGMHSNESCRSAYKKLWTCLMDLDVVSFYPSLIINSGFFPPEIGVRFLHRYEEILVDRLKAKEALDKKPCEMFKIILNGIYGKLGSKWSIFYSPQLLLYITLTGQLSLLMLIEMMSDVPDVEMLSANTDGILLNLPLHALASRNYNYWQTVTGLKLEETNYKATHNRDVNNYIAVKTDGTLKLKGIFAKDAVDKNPMYRCCIEAVIQYVTNKTPIEDTINKYAHDPKMLILTRKVGGFDREDYGVWKGEKLGKTVRWYYATDGEPIYTFKKGDKVASSDFARPLMDLSEPLQNVHIEMYVQKAKEILKDIGIEV